MSNLTSAFNDHFTQFLNDILIIFPEEKDILTAKNSLLTIRKINPKLLVHLWKEKIVDKYKQEIEDGDINFFIQKDYTTDIYHSQSDKIMQAIDRLRNPISEMNENDRAKTMKYIQNLSKLSELCYNESLSKNK